MKLRVLFAQEIPGIVPGARQLCISYGCYELWFWHEDGECHGVEIVEGDHAHIVREKHRCCKATAEPRIGRHPGFLITTLNLSYSDKEATTFTIIYSRCLLW